MDFGIDKFADGADYYIGMMCKHIIIPNKPGASTL